jgi:hypothetical protein
LKVVLPPPLPKPAGPKRKSKKKWWVKPASCLAAALLVLIVCVGGPTAAVLSIINSVSDKVKHIADDQNDAKVEWNAVSSMWQGPAVDAPEDVLFPPTFGEGKYSRMRVGTDAADPELGITLPGRCGHYSGLDGEVMICVYRCPEDQAKAIERKVYDRALALTHGTAAIAPGSNRRKAYYAGEDSGLRTVTYSFHDGSNSQLENGKLWYAQGWLFWFRTAAPTQIEPFPPKYLLEVARRAGAKSK